MPHDAKGTELKVGDTVLVPFKVKSIGASELYCNVDLEACATVPPEHTFRPTLSAINSRMMVRANEGDDTRRFYILYQDAHTEHQLYEWPDDNAHAEFPAEREG
jgi:hypothetical protein